METDNNSKNDFKIRNKFLNNKKLNMVAGLILITGIVISTWQSKRIISLFETYGQFILEQTTGFFKSNYSSILILIILLIIALFLSHYLIRSVYLDTNISNKYQKRLSRIVYYFANLMYAFIEVMFMGFIFMLIYVYGLGVLNTNISAIAYFGIAVIPGILGLILFYIIYSVLNNYLFTKIYGGYFTIDELKWNRDLIDAFANILFIVAIISSIISINLGTQYTYNEAELQLLSMTFLLTIATYVIKVIKNFSINFIENKK